MSIQKATAQWNGTLKEGNGVMNIQDYSGPFTFASRFEQSGKGTNPEELVGAAISGCFSMFLSALIDGEGVAAESVKTVASVNLESDDIGPLITSIALDCEVKCEGLSQEKFEELTAAAKEKCPISRLYAGTTKTLSAKLV